MHLRPILVILALVLCERNARATCSFDAASGILTVTQGGGTLTIGSGGAIQLGGSPCGSATTASTMRIVVNGSPTLRDYLQLRGTFAPGRDDGAETGLPEIEIELIGFTGNNDEIFLVGGGAAEIWRFTSGAIDLNGDGDGDMTAPSDGMIRLKSLNGNDVIDAGAYTGTADLQLRGGLGNDTLTGGPGNDFITGDEGNDTLFGGPGNDTIYHGLGADRVRAGAGNDLIEFDTSGLPNGAGDEGDDFRGNAGYDEVSYITRDTGVVVSIDNLADDGEPGESDNVHLDIEWVTGGSGDDVLVESDGDDTLDGTWGYNELYGGAGDDWLQGGFDGCLVVGDAGNDRLFGSTLADVLDGGPGDDRLEGFSGNDTLDGGAGVNRFFGGFGDDLIFNDDGIAETVDCGPGVDNPEPSAGDTFVACENI